MKLSPEPSKRRQRASDEEMTLLRSSEAYVQFWHRQDEGFANRKPISELPVEGAGPVS